MFFFLSMSVTLIYFINDMNVLCFDSPSGPMQYERTDPSIHIDNSILCRDPLACPCHHVCPFPPASSTLKQSYHQAVNKTMRICTPRSEKKSAVVDFGEKTNRASQLAVC